MNGLLVAGSVSALSVSCGSASHSGGGGGEAEDESSPDVQDGEQEIGGDPAAEVTLAIADAAARPDCGDANQSQLIYVMADKEFQVCKDEAWKTIEIAGKDGKDGKDGDDGKDGNDGTSNTMVATVFCTGDLEGAPYAFSYDAKQYASGEVFVAGTIRNASIQVSNATIYSSKQVGYAEAPISMSLDALGDDNDGWWQLSLDRDTLITTIQYNDVDNAGGDPMVWTMDPDKCVINDFSDD